MSNQTLLSEQEKKVVEHAIQEDISLTKAARCYVKEGSVRALVRRIKRNLKKAPGGEELIFLFLRQGASYDRQIAGEIVCNPRQTEDLIVWSKVPISDICNKLSDEQNTYQVLYNRIYRKDPKLASDLTDNSNESETPVSTFQFFTIGHHELQSIE